MGCLCHTTTDAEGSEVLGTLNHQGGQLVIVDMDNAFTQKLRCLPIVASTPASVCSEWQRIVWNRPLSMAVS